jgi:ubiquinone/menaquinone biosynthesis C-methylase UbiE
VRAGRKRAAAALLRRAGAFPVEGDPCLEIGYGQIGWLSELIEWGVRAPDLAGIEINAERAAVARRRLPDADLRIGDATALPWDAAFFQLVIASTVFSSVLDADVRARIAGEMWRVLRPGGSVLCYDLTVRNPANPHVQGMPVRAFRQLFPAGDLQARRVTLAPALGRFVARSWAVSTCLEAVPWLRTHVVVVIRKA